jgi:Ca2+-binding EF-hand superfamily protein
MLTMTRFTTMILMSLTLFTGACDDHADDAVPAAEAESTEVEVAREGRRGGKLAGLDADKDGAITLAEARGSRVEAKFAELDADRDGKLTREEMAAMKRHGGRGFHKDPGKRAEMLLGKLDADKDGALSRAELAAKFSEHKAKFAEKFAEKFTAADANADGELNREELAAMKGGRHGGRGFHKDPAKRAEFVLGRLDTDKDGAISKAEVDGSRFAARFAAVDADGDARVTREELIAFRPERGERRGR